MRVKSILSHSVQAVAEGALIASLVVGLLAGTALAGKPSAGTASVSVVYMDGATEAHFAARVTFNISTTATSSPFIHLKCWQGGTLVEEAWQGFFSTALGHQWIYLGPTPLWQSGDAECTAYVEKSTKRGFSVLGSTSFHVYP
jgi:hypothetical protein